MTAWSHVIMASSRVIFGFDVDDDDPVESESRNIF